MSQITFTDRVVAITGAGRGLGREHALDFARRGAAVLVNDLGGTGFEAGASNSAADEVVAEIRAAGGRAVANYDSVSTRSGGQAIIECAMDNFGRIDAVVNNAGFLRNKVFEDLGTPSSTTSSTCTSRRRSTSLSPPTVSCSVRGTGA
ncbi:SDR family NAD(P)-dependent oxidoreductase [Streptomyces ureilyticus]|uniref:SDR family NAD(P)-dependent oxidoreductase n=1 Tax=Streptomyces ureilyticus TaxID=1775131 RepID=UPI0022A8A745|nr:SDR family NAD(P)-dependent oxidoreductase [Streptomyces ureilyticus]